MSRTQVLVVGAGPTGLAAALVLRRLGVTVRIIDKSSARSDKSKALAVHSGTLECLKAAIGPTLVRDLIGAGRPTRNAWIHLDENVPISVDLGTIPSAYDFILNLEQSETERILERHLNESSVQVERFTECMQATDRGAAIVSRVRLPSGEIEEVESAFLIGCDGAHSTVRRLFGIEFHGSAYTGDFILGDVTLQWSWPYDSVRLFVNHRGVIAAFPLRGEQRYRLILIRQEKGAAAEAAGMTLGEFQSILSELSAGRMTALDAVWLTRFRVHHRMVRHLRRGRMFLAGDAAHIHSPAGGQGMNTGIQDALNLGFKLAKAIAHGVSESALNDYERERLPVARRVLRVTDLVSRLALMPEGRFKSVVRGKLLPIAVRSRRLQRRAVAIISEVAVARREISRYGPEQESPGTR